MLILKGYPLSSGPWAVRRLECCEGKLELFAKPELRDILCPKEVSACSVRIRVRGSGLVHGCCWSQDRKIGQLQKKRKTFQTDQKMFLRPRGQRIPL